MTAFVAEYVVHLPYRAQEGGGVSRNGAVAGFKTRIEEPQAAGSVRLFSVRTCVRVYAGNIADGAPEEPAILRRFVACVDESVRTGSRRTGQT